MKNSTDKSRVDNLIIDEMKKEAEAIEKAAMDNPEEFSEKEVDLVFQRTVQELKDKGLYKEHKEETASELTPDLEAMKKEYEQRLKHLDKLEAMAEKSRKTRRRMQWVAMVVLIVIGVFGISMTSQANRIYLINAVDKIFGSKTDSLVSGEEADLGVRDEKEAKANIEKSLHVEVPSFYYTPDSWSFLSAEVVDNDEMAFMRYEVDDTILTLQISLNDTFSSQGISYDSDNIETMIMKMSGETIKLYHTMENNKQEYWGEWIHKNNFYSLYGTIDLQEMQNILQNIIY